MFNDVSLRGLNAELYIRNEAAIGIEWLEPLVLLWNRY